MNNTELSKALLEQAEILLEYSNHGDKGNTTISYAKNGDMYDTGRTILKNTKYGRYALRKSDKDLDKKIDKVAQGGKKASDTLEKMGKDARKQQSMAEKMGEVARKLGRLPDPGEDIKSLGRGAKDITPIKDKEKMRKQNIKLGYQILDAAKEGRKRSDGNETIHDRVNKNGPGKTVHESISKLLIETAELLLEDEI